MSRRQVRHLPHSFNGQTLRAARLAAGWTQEDLAHEIGMTLRTVQRYEEGLGEPKGSKLLQLCTILGVDPDALFDERVAA